MSDDNNHDMDRGGQFATRAAIRELRRILFAVGAQKGLTEDDVRRHAVRILINGAFNDAGFIPQMTRTDPATRIAHLLKAFLVDCDTPDRLHDDSDHAPFGIGDAERQVLWQGLVDAFQGGRGNSEVH